MVYLKTNSLTIFLLEPTEPTELTELQLVPTLNFREGREGSITTRFRASNDPIHLFIPDPRFRIQSHLFMPLSFMALGHSGHFMPFSFMPIGHSGHFIPFSFMPLGHSGHFMLSLHVLHLGSNPQPLERKSNVGTN